MVERKQISPDEVGPIWDRLVKDVPELPAMVAQGIKDIEDGKGTTLIPVNDQNNQAPYISEDSEFQ